MLYYFTERAKGAGQRLESPGLALAGAVEHVEVGFRLRTGRARDRGTAQDQHRNHFPQPAERTALRRILCRLAERVGHLGGGSGYLRPQIKDRSVDLTPHGQIATAAPGREAG